MRRLSRWALAGAVVVLATSSPALAQGNDLTGQRAPEIYVQEGVQGIATGASLAACRGQVVVLKFWFTRCPSCRKSMPEFQELYQRFSPRGVRFVAIAYDETSRVLPYLRSTGFTFPVAMDPSGVTATRYGVFTYPTTYLIGADGIVKAYDRLSPALIEGELEAARLPTRPNAGRRPLGSFPRAGPTPPASPVAPPTAAADPAPVPPAAPAAPAPVADGTSLAAAPLAPEEARMPAPPPPAPSVPESCGAPVAAPASALAPDPAAAPALAPSEAAAAAAPVAGLAALPIDAAPPPVPPLPVDPALASAPSAPLFALPPRDRVLSGSVTPSEPASAAQPTRPGDLTIPSDPAHAPVAPTPSGFPPSVSPAASASAPVTSPMGGEPTSGPPVVAAPAGPFSGAAAAMEAGDFPTVLRGVEAYARTHPDAASWLPGDLEEARRLEGRVNAEYLRRHADIRALWGRGEVAPAVESARALAAEYRGTNLERSASALLSWFEANRPVAAGAR